MDATKLSIFVSVLLLFRLLKELNAKPSYSVTLDYMNCYANPAYANPPNCSMDMSFDPPRGYSDIQMHRSTNKLKFQLKAQITIRKRTRTVLNLRNQDVCAFFEGRVMTIVLYFKSLLDNFGKLPDKCPVDKDFRYVFKNIAIDSSKLPPFLVEGDFHITTNNTIGKEFVFLYEFKGKIRKNFE